MQGHLEIQFLPGVGPRRARLLKEELGLVSPSDLIRFYPFRYVVFAECDDRFSVEVLFSVPKKNHKRANVRNLLRRRTKEAYRLNKSILHECGKMATVDMALIYSSKEIVDYKTIENAVRKILSTVAEDL